MEKNKIINLLEKKFKLEVISSVYSKCFDFLFKKESSYYFVKIYNNLNSLNSKINKDLINLESFLETNSIIISEKTSRNYLGNYIYLRKNIKVFNLRTFLNYLEDKEIPIFRYGKIVVNIDFEEMKKRRIELGYSLFSLSKKLNISKKHLYEIENGKKNPSYFLAKKLEKILDKKLIIKSNKSDKIINKCLFIFSNFCSIKGIKKKEKKYIIPRNDNRALEESEEIAKIFGLKII